MTGGSLQIGALSLDDPIPAITDAQAEAVRRLVSAQPDSEALLEALGLRESHPHTQESA